MDESAMGDAITCDVVVVGGGAAGMAAALQLGRSRRPVVVVDAGEPRNAPATHVHGYLGREATPPAEFLAIAREEVGRYGVRLLDGRVREVTRHDQGGFSTTLGNGTVVLARRVLVATGIVDVLPDIPGVAAQWGRGVIHCPYCHGWEVRDRRIVVIGTNARCAHQAGLFRQLSDRVTLVVHEGAGPDAADRLRLTARGVTIVERAVVQVVADGHDDVTGVRLDDGTVLPADAVVVAPNFRSRADVLAALGITPVAHPSGFGTVVAADVRGATTVPGVYAAGNLTDPTAQVLQCAAAGAQVGAVINADLVSEDADRAVRSARFRAQEWDERYGGRPDRLWSGRPNGALVTEVADTTPGRALDIGCGEGADAIWLAARGWNVTAVDISEVALDRAAAAARDACVSVDWLRADLVEDPPASRAYDLVSVQYPALPRTPDHDIVGALIDAVAPGGILLVVGHALNGCDARDHDHDHDHGPADHLQPADVASRLDDGWDVAVDETRPRVGADADAMHVEDIVLKARRRS